MFFKLTHCLFITALLSSLSYGQQIEWSTNLDAAKARAASENKQVLLHFTADWCGGCQQLKKFVFNNISVIRSVDAQVVPVKVDVDMNPELVEQYGVKAIPFDVTITPDGNVVMQQKSPGTRDEYLRMLGNIAKTRQSAVARSNDLVQQQLVEQLAANEPNELDRGMDFRSDLIDFRPSKKTIDPVLGNSNDFAHFAPQQTTEHSMPVAQPPELSLPDFQPAAPSAPSAGFAATPGFTPNKSFNGGQFAPSGSQARPQIPDPVQQAVEVVRPRVRSQRIINEMINDNQSLASTNTAPNARPLQPSSATIHAPFSAQAENPVASAATNPEQQTPTPSAPEPSFALSGNCPVTLLSESKWVKGDKQWGCVHRGRTYVFVSQAKMQEFLSTPDKYSPILAGFDPVDFHERGQLTEGQESLGVFMSKAGQQKVVLFSSPENRAKFQAEPKTYLQAVQIATQRLDENVSR